MPNDNVLTDAQLNVLFELAKKHVAVEVFRRNARALLAAHPDQPDPRAEVTDEAAASYAYAQPGSIEFDGAEAFAQHVQSERVKTLIVAAEQVVSADRACALDDSDINALAAAIDAARTGASS